ncbi:hypothetical protein RCL1_002520 [Eukaryota sp. TZLM3-RCL]
MTGAFVSESRESEILGPFALPTKKLPLYLNVIRYFLLFTLAPFRVVCLFTFVFAALIWASICSIGSGFSRTQTLSRWRITLIKNPVRLVARLVMYCCGFNWINKNSFPKLPEGTPYILLSNHLSFVDILTHLYLTFPSFVAKKETLNIPVVGLISSMMRCVFVDREDLGSRNKTLEAIRERVENFSNYDYPLLIFPEGTIANGTAIPRFKVGAFTPCKPFIIALVHYECPFWNPNWVAKGLLSHIFKLASSPHNKLVLRYYTYIPSNEEEADPNLYMNNVRQFFADELNVPLSSYGYRHHAVGLKYYSGRITLDEAEVMIRQLSSLTN